MNKMVQRGLMGAVLLGFGFSGPAQAAPITVNPGTLVASGPVQAVFAFQDAADTSRLLAVSIAGTIFNNQTTAIGTIMTVGNVGPFPSPIWFELHNVSQGYSFFTGIADTVQVGGQDVFYATYKANFADFGVGALPAAAAAAIASDPILSAGPLLFVGFEDRRGGDYDYNDLIFAFAPIGVPSSIPEPGILALLGLGLVGLGAGRLRKQ